MREEPTGAGHGGSTAGDERLDPPRDIHVLLIVLLAFAARLPAILASTPPFPGDGQAFDAYALRIASGLGFGPSSSLPPLYPYFLGMLYRIYGYGPNTVMISQAMIGSLAVVPVIALGRLAGLQRREVLLSGVLFALFPQAATEARHMTPVVLLGAVLPIGVLAWLRRPGAPSIVESLLAGAILGGMILGRVGLALPILALIAARGIHEYARAPGVGIHRVRSAASVPVGVRLELWMRRGFVLVAAFCVIAPWAIRSSKLHGRSVFVESTWGLRLRAANVPDVPVARYYLPGAHTKAPDNMVLTENKIAFQELLGYAATHPGRLAMIWAGRISRFFGFSPMSDSGFNDPFPYRLLWFRVLQAAVYGLMLSLALGWLVLLRGVGGIERTLALAVLGFAALGVVSGRPGDARLLSLPYLSVLAGRGLHAIPLPGRVGKGARVIFLCLLVALWVQGLRAGGLL